ncbi:MAG: glycosyltransferase family 39 protein [Candidatus Berkelbacteria bacterium]|nr:glycosyltransferase family 39 protein [Candidatus Berkelbacteria bacterium]
MNIFNRWGEKKFDILAVVLIVVFVFACFWKLGNCGLADWDEAIYAEISRNVLHGHFFTLFWNGANWFQKPPMAFWLQAGAFKLFGVSEFSARFVSATSGVILAWITYIFSRKLFNQKIAIIALLLFVSDTFLLFYSRFGTTDVLVACLATAALYFFWLSEERKTWLYPFFLLIGLAVMTKGPAGLSPLLIIIIYLIITRQFLSYFKNIHAWIGILLMLVVMLPWHIYMLEKFGLGFWQQYYSYQIVLRSKVAIEGHTGPWYFYLQSISRYLPIVIFLPLFFLVPKETVKKYQNPIIFIALWLIVQFITIQSVATKIEWYILPVHLPLVITLAVIIFSIISRSKICVLPTVFLLLLTALIPLYRTTRWRENKIYQTNKICLATYQSLASNQNRIYYLDGYSLPTTIFYLQPKMAYYYETGDYKKIPIGMKALIKDQKPLPIGSSVVSDAGCKVVEQIN